jgi:hypothetical protein
MRQAVVPLAVPCFPSRVAGLVGAAGWSPYPCLSVVGQTVVTAAFLTVRGIKLGHGPPAWIIEPGLPGSSAARAVQLDAAVHRPRSRNRCTILQTKGWHVILHHNNNTSHAFNIIRTAVPEASPAEATDTGVVAPYLVCIQLERAAARVVHHILLDTSAGQKLGFVEIEATGHIKEQTQGHLEQDSHLGTERSQ